MSTSTRRDSITLRFLAAPTDVGVSGTVEAGTVLEWVDKAAYAAAVGWAGSYCVTAYVGNIHFADPVHSGDLVEVTASVVYTGTSSMHIRTEVTFSDPRERRSVTSTTCLVIFVAVDEQGKPTKVPSFEPRTAWQLEMRERAIARIGIREKIVAAMKDQEYTDAGTAERVVLRFLAAPTDVNWGGKVHGGIVMKWIDEAAALCAARYCQRETVAVFSGGVRFYRPLFIGDLVEVEARLVYTGTKGMHVAVHVRSGDPKGTEMNLTTYCLTVMVARDETGTAVPVPPWVPVSAEDRRLSEHARELLAIRADAPGGYQPKHLRSPFAKICGLSTESEVQVAVEHGARAVGFVLTESPRQVSVERARQLAQGLPEHVPGVAVFRHEEVQQAIGQTKAAGLTWIQLHGERTSTEVAQAQRAGLTVVRAVRISDAAQAFEDRGEDWLLVDASVPGSGEAWDYAAARQLTAGRSNILLAGGLDPENVVRALQLSGAAGADVSSGVERSRGVKDPQKITAFLNAVHASMV